MYEIFAALLRNQRGFFMPFFLAGGKIILVENFLWEKVVNSGRCCTFTLHKKANTVNGPLFRRI